ncbi:hypothetical protein TIFTF001_037434 [Ficus carica]|uniref:Uncharacterized protein n=1 Tax=Ficus carica TaxID=3494 RepID=A0AA88E5B3_FICCA|nr:hypothetical protein TIFTF001_037409 [Ficus carica]GMN68359.1 hypothetical protein TIFTF001_037420 [Ficus carica]GMN68372.1 hypothetical protein TIFTF001_037423 [Ficus carica]GMN68373.1 hypothetical protein TIFTF001_037434 [Ficus carica]
MHVNEKSMGRLANTFYPSWGLLHNDLKKPPLKALLFEEKLELFLAQPYQEWDEINVLEKLRASSLWKDFVKIETDIIKQVPSWVDWPFVIRGALRRLFGTPLKKAQKEAAKVAAAEKAAQSKRATEPPSLPVIESSLEPPTMSVQSPAKKRKADEKPKRKVPAKRKKMSKAYTSETDLDLHSSKQEDKNIEADLPPGTSLFQNKSINVGIMRQLLSDVDSDAINEGRIQSHLDEFLWDADKVVEQKKLVKGLHDKDRERGEKLLDIKRRFKDMKSNSNGMIDELHSLKQKANEGVEMMKVMLDRFNETLAKIKTLEESLKEKEADNSVLVARIVDAYERATLKAHYDLLKEYKQGLLVDANVEEEIELYKDFLAEAGGSSFAPIDVAVPTLN